MARTLETLQGHSNISIYLKYIFGWCLLFHHFITFKWILPGWIRLELSHWRPTDRWADVANTRVFNHLPNTFHRVVTRWPCQTNPEYLSQMFIRNIGFSVGGLFEHLTEWNAHLYMLTGTGWGEVIPVPSPRRNSNRTHSVDLNFSLISLQQ